MRKLGIVLGSVLLAWLGLVHARSDSLVQRYFQDLTSLRANFEQTVFDAESRLLETSSGQMLMRKPGQFRFEYKKPAGQLILADGKHLWTYDSELKQVSVKTLDKALSSTPLALLSGAAPLQEAFTVGPPIDRDNLQWYELKPKEEQSEFKMLRVAFKGETLHSIELEDTLNQRTRLDFTQPERNVALDPTLFTFTPPPGVDVIGDAPR